MSRDPTDGSLAALERYRVARDAWLADLARRVTADSRVRAVWLVGSLGRSDGDALSDVDLVVVPTNGALRGLVADPLAVLPLPAPVLLRVDKPGNAPAGGAYTGVCVELVGLPLWLDVYVWPAASAVLPADAALLVGDPEEEARRDRRGFIALLNGHRDLTAGDHAAAGAADNVASVLLRVSVAAKYLARGDIDRLDQVTRAWNIPAEPPAAVAEMRRLADSAAAPVRPLIHAWIDVCESLVVARAAATPSERTASCGVVVRPERTGDARVVAALHVAAWRVGYAGILPDDVLAGLDIDEWAERRETFLREPRPGIRTLVADVNGATAGFVTYGPDTAEPPAGRIWACYVHPDRWGKGIADQLIMAALTAVPDPTVRLWVLEDNHRAQRFYQRHGFHPDGARDRYQPAGSTDTFPQIRYTLSR